MGNGTDFDYATVGYDNSGNELWVSRYNGPGNDWDKATSIAIDDSGNLYVTGHCCGDADINLNPLGDIGTVGYDSVTGTEFWSDVYASSSGFRDMGKDIAVDQSGNVYVTGYQRDDVTFEDYFTIKYLTQNVAPTAIAGPDLVISENEVVQLDGSLSFDSDGALISYSWDLDINYDSNGDTVPDNDVDVTGPTPIVASWNDDHISTVRLTVKDDDGNTATDIMTVTVENLDPVGGFNVSHDAATGFSYNWTASDPGSDDLTVTLEIGPLTPIIEVYFNDGVGPDPIPSPYTGPAPFAIADSGVLPSSLPPGTYDCNFTVMDDDLGTYERTTRVTVVNRPPVANFSYLPLDPVKDEDVQFTDSSTDPDGPIVAWSWDFGDVSSSVLQDPTHPYSDIDSYTVTLTVWDEQGASNSTSKVIDVINRAPVAEFSYSPDDPKVNGDVTFTDLSTDPDNDLVSWEWDFGDGTTSTNQNPTHSYSGTGTYSVTLTIWDSHNGTDSIITNRPRPNSPLPLRIP
jgi:PKD repeat protein